MIAKAIAKLDVEVFKRAYEEWDIERCSASTPMMSSSSRSTATTRRARRACVPAKEVLRGMLEHCAAAGVRATVEHAIAGEDRAAATVRCEFPGGRKVLANAILDLQDGRIVRERDVLAGDPKAL